MGRLVDAVNSYLHDSMASISATKHWKIKLKNICRKKQQENGIEYLVNQKDEIIPFEIVYSTNNSLKWHGNRVLIGYARKGRKSPRAQIRLAHDASN